MKPSAALYLLIAASALASLLAGCSKSESPVELAYPSIKVGNQTITVEFAITQAEQRKGLMLRDGIADNHGMLFIYREPQGMSYWMKNVDFPIDIGFFTADGVLREVYPMYPQDTLARKSIRDDILYALETRYQWFSDNEIRPGSRLDLESLRLALASKR